jgi:hypothetical protein
MVSEGREMAALRRRRRQAGKAVSCAALVVVAACLPRGQAYFYTPKSARRVGAASKVMGYAAGEFIIERRSNVSCVQERMSTTGCFFWKDG